MLDLLPAELVLEIISFLSYRDTMAMATTCRTLHTLVLELPGQYYRHWVLQYLHLVQDGRKVSRVVVVAGDAQHWKAEFREAYSLFRRLVNCPPPGCPYQKYLRWLQGKPADCGIVRRVLVGVSMLPPTIRDMTEPVKTDQYMVCFTERSRIILNWLFPKEREYLKRLDKIVEVENPIGQFFNFRHFKALVEYVMEENERLRLVMAEYHQIQCRGLFEDTGFVAWTRPASIIQEIESLSPAENFREHGRQMGALLDLLSINSQAPGIRFWA